jgi:hypothetical protein
MSICHGSTIASPRAQAKSASLLSASPLQLPAAMNARSSISKLLSIVSLTATALTAQAGESAPGPDPGAVLDKFDDLFRGKSSHGELSMEILTSHGRRQLSLEQWSLGSSRFLVRILGPERERGNATLKVDRDIWNYLPNVDRTIKLSTAMLSGAWMGSHFSNNDLIRHQRLRDTYDATITFKGARAEGDVIELALVPKKDAAVVWGKLVLTARPDGLPLRMDYYDEALKQTQTMTFSDIKVMGARALPTRVRMQPTAKPEEHTELRYRIMQFDIPLEESFFSARNLQKR